MSLRALYVGSTSKFSSEQRHDLISTTFQRCSNVRCPLGYVCACVCVCVYTPSEVLTALRYSIFIESIMHQSIYHIHIVF